MCLKKFRQDAFLRPAGVDFSKPAQVSAYLVSGRQNLMRVGCLQIGAAYFSTLCLLFHMLVFFIDARDLIGDRGIVYTVFFQ